MASVALKNVSKFYGPQVQAVRDATIDIRDQEFLVLVGPSGCGKTTILRMIAGLEEASSGDIFISDRRVNDVAPKDRDIAMVFQNYALYPHMNVFDNISFGLKLRRTPKSEIKRRVAEASRLLGIESLLNRKPKELSGGQRQRVAMGRAIIREPKVFLMDEPLSNLDAQLRVQMRAELQKLHRRLGVTTIYVTHDQTEAMTLGSRIVTIRDGVIQQIDTPLNLYDRPANLFVAGFIGSPSMNFAQTRVAEKEGALFLQGRGFEVKVPEIHREKTRAYLGQTVTFGIRPEDIYDRGFAREFPEEDALEAVVEVYEPLGAEVFLYLSVGQETLTARVDSNTKASIGVKMQIVPDLRKMHLFDSATGKILLEN